MECPECKIEIGKSSYCGCGWRKPKSQTSPEPLRIECAHESCQYRAIVKIHTLAGWANLCRFHYDQHYTDAARKRCELLGLNTVAQKREWVRQEMKTLYAKLAQSQPLREPGEDESFTYLQA